MALRKMMPHQATILQLAKEHQNKFGMWMAPGTGKTLPAIRGARTPAIVIGRRDDFMTWERELALEEVDPHRIQFLESSSEQPAPPSEVDWTITTYGLTRNKHVSRWIREQGFRSAIVDEAHAIKRWKTKQTKTVISSTREANCRFALTGTPLTNKAIEDIFSQALFIDDGQQFGTSWWKFMNRYFIRLPGMGWVPRRDAKERVKAGLKKIAYYVDEDDVLDLPPVRRFVIEITPTGIQRRLTKQLEDLWEVNEDIQLSHVVVQVEKLKQIASGFYYDNQKVAHHIRCRKYSRLCEMLTNPEELESSPKFVVWASHLPEIHRIQRTLPVRSVIMHGTDATRNDQARRQFRDNPNVRAFICQVDKGVGMNELVVAADAVYFSNSRRLVSRDQSRRRTRRKGSHIHKVCRYWDLVTKGSVDEGVLRALMSNQDYSRQILESIRGGINRVSDVLHSYSK